MRPHKRSESGTYPGFSVRLAYNNPRIKDDSVHDDLAKLKILALLEGFRTPNRLIVKVALEIASLIDGKRLSFSTDNLLLRARKEESAKIWRELASQDVRRSLPNSCTYPVKLSFLPAGRKDLNDLSCRLRWAEGQILMEALHAFAVLASAKDPFESVDQLPDLLRLGLAERSFHKLGELTAKEIHEGISDGNILIPVNVLSAINVGLSLVLRPKIERVPNQIEEPMDSSSLNLIGKKDD